MGMIETASRIIARFGQSATLTKPGAVSGPSYAPVYGPAVDHPVTVAVTEYTVEDRANTSRSDSDLRVFMAAGVAPTTADKLTIGGVEYSLQRVGTLGPDGVTRFYDLQVRR